MATTKVLRVLRVIRRLALVGIVLSVLALPLGLISLASALSKDIGDNGMGDVFAFAAGPSLLMIGVAGLILGCGLAVLAKRALPDPVEIAGSRPGRTARHARRRVRHRGTALMSRPMLVAGLALLVVACAPAASPTPLPTPPPSGPPPSTSTGATPWSGRTVSPTALRTPAGSTKDPRS